MFLFLLYLDIYLFWPEAVLKEKHIYIYNRCWSSGSPEFIHVVSCWMWLGLGKTFNFKWCMARLYTVINEFTFTINRVNRVKVLYKTEEIFPTAQLFSSRSQGHIWRQTMVHTNIHTYDQLRLISLAAVVGVSTQRSNQWPNHQNWWTSCCKSMALVLKCVKTSYVLLCHVAGLWGKMNILPNLHSRTINYHWESNQWSSCCKARTSTALQPCDRVEVI